MRSIKPEFWNDLAMAALSRDARLLYIACWNQADEHGRMHGDRRWIKGHCLPYDDDLSLVDIDRLITELCDAGKVVRYAHKGEAFLHLPNLAEHQRLEPSKVPSRHPDPAESTPDLVPSAPRANESAPDANEPGTIVAKHVACGSEHVAGGMGHTRGADKPRTPRRTRIAADFEPTRDMRLWAAEQTPTVNVDAQTEQFRDYHTGKGSTQADWTATWRTWMRNAVKFQRGGRGSTQQAETDDFFERAMARAIEKDSA